MLTAGTHLGPYEILSPLGAGGMGEVYRAKDTKLDRHVAIKVLPADVASSPERLQRFEREAKTVAALNHPNIVTIHAIEHADGHNYIAMELVEGESLDRMIAQGGMPLARIFDISIPIADALAAAHDKSIVHRDLKPANVMVTKEARVKVLDFGLAKLTASGQGNSPADDVTMSAPLTGRGQVLGTVPYMSPEQLKSKPVDHRSDIFSLGIMLYEMASGTRPFTGDDSATVMSAILRDTPRPVQELNSVLPRHLGRIVARCLKKDPHERYQTARDVCNELRELQKEVNSGSELSESQPVSIQTAVSPPLSSTSSTSVSGSSMSAPAKRGELWIGVAAIAVIILLVGLWIGRRDGVSEETTTHDALSNTTPSMDATTGIAPAPEQPPQPRTSLAILPFRDNSPTPQEWLASGLADAISTRLGRINASKLGVLGPETTAFYAQPGKSIQDLTNALNVDFVLRGSIQTIDKAVRISANLIRADDFTSDWSDEFNGSLDDPFALQSMVAEKIIAGLPFALSGEETVRLKKVYTAKPEAELAYMQGQFFSPGGGGVKKLLRAVSYFEQAIEIDPEYALAYCGLVKVKCSLATWGALRTAEIRSDVKDAMATAMALDDSLAEVYLSKGRVSMFLDWDWSEAVAAFTRAIEISPSSETYLAFGSHMRLVGRHDDAMEGLEQAIGLNPVSLSALANLGMLYGCVHRLADAEAVLQRALEIDNDFLDALVWLADVRQKQGRFDEAITIMEHAVFSVDERDIPLRCYLGNAYAMAGRTEDARKQLVVMQQLAEEGPAPHLFFAEMHAALGEKDEAFARLDQAFEEREAWLPHIRLEPGLIHIRNDPHFAELHRKMGLGHVDLSYASKLVPTTSAQETKTMLAVLPFANLSGDPEQEYFSDGMTEEMITRLGRLRPELLGVIARTSAMRYKKTDKLIDQIGRELGVAYVIEGGVRRSGDSVRINAQLIQVSDQTQLWGDSYTRDLSDVFAVQSEVAEAVAEALAVELLPDARMTANNAPTKLSEAHDAYLLGRHFWVKRTVEDLETSITHFQRAIALDPAYALAYAGLADAYSTLPGYKKVSKQESISRSREAAEQALEIDDHLAEAHTAMASALTYSFEYNEAVHHFRRAIDLNPNYATAHQWYAECLIRIGRVEESIQHASMAVQLDPQSPIMSYALARSFADGRRFDEAVQQAKRTVQLGPGWVWSHRVLAECCDYAGRYEDAVAAFQKATPLAGGTDAQVEEIGRSFAAGGIRGVYAWFEQELTNTTPKPYYPLMAVVAARLGKADEAFANMDDAIAAQLNILLEPHFDSLRDDPRYDDLLRRVGLEKIEIPPPSTTP